MDTRTVTNTSAAIATLSLAWIVYKLSQVGKREEYLPPGPPTAPLLGNLHIFPKSEAHYQLTKWAQEYGEIYSLKMGSATAVVITSAAAVKELMDKNSHATADRPANHMVQLITDGGLNMVLAHYNDTWRSLRRGAHEILTPQACEQHLPIQQAEATQLMYDLMTKPEEFYTSVRRYSSSVILSVLFGKRAPQFSTPEVTAFFHAQHLWEHALEPGAHPPVDLIPILQKVPERFASWKSLCKEVRRLQQRLYFGLLEEVEKRTARGEANGCWMETVCERAEEWGMNRQIVGYLGGVLIEGGSDTTSSFLQSLILALVAFPEVQKKAQEEIDRVIGSDRAPVLSDIEHLPYIQAIIKETHRFRPVAPLAIPHSTIADVTYKGYHIPAGTTIFVNNWGIFHDPQVYENPEIFNPDRFIESEFGTRPEARDSDKDRRNNLAFGSGRRICPGIHLANNSLMINTMNLLWGFTFSKAVDPKTGLEIEPDIWDYAKGILTCPNPFKCTIKPRSVHHAEIIKRQFAEATPAFLPFEHELCDEDKEFVRLQRSGL
ncbi:hypothetical protein FRC03_011695 [Tulasnella sp. 419]|nr:hypothetical protein FRC03_011695 [Tulasnella sp. 419]